MKQLKSFFLLCLSLTILASCKEDDDKPDEPNYGIQYFECRINGEPLEVSSNPFTCNGLYFNYYPEPYLNSPAGYAILRGRSCQTYTGAAIRINGLDHQTGELDFLQPAFADSIYPYYRYNDDSLEEPILYEKLVSGSMYIEEFIPGENGSSPLGTIKGTFEFTVTDETGIDTIRVTEGRFRFDVPQIF
jgi:hypothetical protein